MLDTSDFVTGLALDAAEVPPLSNTLTLSNVVGSTIGLWSNPASPVADVQLLGMFGLAFGFWLANLSSVPDLIPVAAAVAPKPMERFIVVDDPTLAMPVLARLQVAADNELILVDASTGIFGVGSTPRGVIDDFLAALRDHAELLAAQEGRLSPDLQEQHAYLQSRLAPSALAAQAR